MTGQLFVKLAANYFGDYRPAVMAEVLATLKDWDEQSIADLWDEMKRTKQTSFKTPPDVFDVINSDAAIVLKSRARQERIDHKTRLLSAPYPDPDDKAVEDFHGKIVEMFRRQA